MYYEDYLAQAKTVNSRFTLFDVELYMKLYATPEDKQNFFGNLQVRDDLDPQLVFETSRNYLASREPCRS